MIGRDDRGHGHRMPRAARRGAVVLFAAGAATLAASFARAGDPPPPKPEAAAAVDPGAARRAAEKRLGEIVAAYRSEKGVEVRSRLVVEARGEGARSKGGEVAAEFVFGPSRHARMRFRDFEVRAFDGRITAVHASNPLAYLDVSDNGSPYYQIFGAFQALPFPELALALGEDDPGEVCMQLMPQLPNVVPAELVEEEVDGQVADVLVLVADDGTEELRLSHDPETKLVERAVGIQRGGEGAEPGAEVVFTVVSEASRPKDPPGDAVFRLDVSSRQKVDGLAALVDRSAEASADRDVGSLKAGEPAPELVLPRAREDGEFSLVAARPRPVVVDFFATWCGPCVASLPELSRIAADFAGRADVILVNAGEQGSREEREARVADVLARRGAVLHVALDLDGQAARRWLVRAFPTTFLVAPDGRIAGVWVGSTPRGQSELRRALEQLCAANAGADAAPAQPGSK